MLWAKESNKKNALFVDIFQSKTVQQTASLIESQSFVVPKKSDAIALRMRKEGNDQFKECEWLEAMAMYNQSLCFAEKGSKHISLAYANRSSCFLHMKMYNECLIDIRLAREAGYPEELMSKLNQREDDCLKCIQEHVASEQFEPKLSYEANAKFPGFANVLKFKKCADDTYSIYANADIDVGQTVAVESAFLKCSIQLGRSCSICLKENSILLPCEHCATAMFCSDECAANFIHKYECGRKYSEDDSLNGGIMEITRAIILGLNACVTVDGLMEFVEQTIASDSNELPESLIDAKSKYRAFLKLPLECDADENTSIAVALCAYKFILTIPQMEVAFESRRHRRFLMHLALHSLKITMRNTFQSFRANPQREYTTLYTQIATSAKYFKHSCAPNAMLAQSNGNLICVTIRPIAKEEPLFILFLDLLLDSKTVRQHQLWKNKKLICRCTRCEGQTATTEQRERIACDPDYHDIISNYPMKKDETHKLPQLIAKCQAFSRKYGHVKWCDEIGRSIDIYMKLLGYQISGPC